MSDFRAFWTVLLLLIVVDSLDAQTAPLPTGTDCNGNGVDDSIDIQNGVIPDANGDGLPDNCGLSVMRIRDFAGRDHSLVLAQLVVTSPVPVQALGFTIRVPAGELHFGSSGLQGILFEDEVLYSSNFQVPSAPGTVAQGHNVVFRNQPPFSNGLPAGVDVPVTSIRLIVADVFDLLPRTIEVSGTLFTSSGLLAVPFTPDAEFQPTEGLIIKRGDFDENGSLTLADAIGVLGYLFTPTAPDPCPDAGDLDDDGVLTLSDLIQLLRVLFLGDPLPSPSCGVDPTPDGLECEFGTVCVQ